MGLVEGIVRKGNDLVIDGLSRGLGNALCNSTGDALLLVTVDEHFSFFFDDLHLLFGDRTADIVRLTHGVAAQSLENGNHLLLIDDAAVGNFQNRLQKGRLIPDLAMIQLIGDKGGNRIHRAGTVKCHNSG